MKKKREAIAWHPAFCSAAEFDLRSERDNLEYVREYNLSKEPLRMDLLIIKKKTEMPGKSDISRIFRRYNVAEYKSPKDTLTIDDVYKTLAYGALYKGLGKQVNAVPAEELTISIFVRSKPKKVFDMLAKEGKAVSLEAKGVYYIQNMLFPMQILVTEELEKKYTGLRVLSDRVTEEDMEMFLLDAMKADIPGDRLNVDSILGVTVSANKGILSSIGEKENMCEALRELMKEDFRRIDAEGEARGFTKGFAEGEVSGEARGIAKGEARTLERVLKIFGVSKEEFLRMEAAHKQMASQE